MPEEEMESISSSVPKDLKERLKARAAAEERTEAVIIRRALKAYMKDWEPGEDVDD